MKINPLKRILELKKNVNWHFFTFYSHNDSYDLETFAGKFMYNVAYRSWTSFHSFEKTPTTRICVLAKLYLLLMNSDVISEMPEGIAFNVKHVFVVVLLSNFPNFRCKTISGSFISFFTYNVAISKQQCENC